MQERRFLPCGGSISDKYNVKIMNRAMRDLDQIYDYIAMTILRNSPMKGSRLLRRHGNVRRYETDSTAPEHLGRAGVFLFFARLRQLPKHGIF